MYNDDESTAETNNDIKADSDIFMIHFKKYKQLKNNQSLKDHEKDILSFKNQTHIQNYLNQSKIKKIDLALKTDEIDVVIMRNYGLKSVCEWNCYELCNNLGFYIIPNPFLKGHQRFLIKKCLSEYHCAPNKTNLDIHLKIQQRQTNLWNDSISQRSFNDFNKLRWTTIGYHYDWTNKVYNENDRSLIPIDIENFCKFIARRIGFEEFQPEAGIINYYHLNSTLSGHQDHSEINMEAPLLSISLGSKALFLIGKTTKSIKPDVVCLNSGDICIMSGGSRLSYHGVPKILEIDNEEEMFDYFTYDDLTDSFMESEYYVNDTEWEMFYDYIKINRINLNIRQVY